MSSFAEENINFFDILALAFDTKHINNIVVQRSMLRLNVAEKRTSLGATNVLIANITKNHSK